MPLSEWIIQKLLIKNNADASILIWLLYRDIRKSLPFQIGQMSEKKKREMAENGNWIMITSNVNAKWKNFPNSCARLCVNYNHRRHEKVPSKIKSIFFSVNKWKKKQRWKSLWNHWNEINSNDFDFDEWHDSLWFFFFIRFTFGGCFAQFTEFIKSKNLSRQLFFIQLNFTWFSRRKMFKPRINLIAFRSQNIKRSECNIISIDFTDKNRSKSEKRFSFRSFRGIQIWTTSVSDGVNDFVIFLKIFRIIDIYKCWQM